MLPPDDPPEAPGPGQAERATPPQAGTPDPRDPVRLILRVGAMPGWSRRPAAVPAGTTRAAAAPHGHTRRASPDPRRPATGRPPAGSRRRAQRPGKPVTHHQPRPRPAGAADAPLRRLDDEILVDHFQFYLVDAHGSDHWPRLQMMPIPFLETAAGVVKFHSRATDHYAAVRMEAWTHEPPPPPGVWDIAREVTLPVASGQVTLWQLMGGRSKSDQPFPLGRPGRYWLRAHARGRRTAHALGPATWRHGVEQYLLQFWPTPR
jgi:hypothetical protein